MAEHALGQLDARRHEEGRPVDGVEAQDVLADDVHVGRPVVPQRVAVIGEADAGDVVGQRIDPHVHDMLGAAGVAAARARHRNAPVERRARDRQIFEAAFDEADDLVAPLRRQDEVRVGVVVRQQLVLVGGQLEEIRLLLRPFDRRALRPATDAVVAEDRLALVVVGLVAHRVPAGVLLQEDIARLVHAPPDLFAGAVVARLGGADEVVVRQAEQPGHLAEALGVAVGQLARRQALLGGRLLHLQPVLVGAGEEIDVLAVEALKARDGIGGDRLVGVADMRLAVGIGDGRGDVELRAPAHGLWVLV